MRVNMTIQPMSAAVVAAIGGQEAQGAQEVASRPETYTMLIEDNGGKLMGYAVFGMDKGGMMAVYYARAFAPVIGPMLMKQFFGVAKVMGVPLRMHIQSARDLEVKARMFGAKFAVEGVDRDGIMQGIFADVL